MELNSIACKRELAMGREREMACMVWFGWVYSAKASGYYLKRRIPNAITNIGRGCSEFEFKLVLMQ